MIYFYMLLLSVLFLLGAGVGMGITFLVTIILIEFLSGALFPIDILPAGIGQVVMSLLSIFNLFSGTGLFRILQSTCERAFN